MSPRSCDCFSHLKLLGRIFKPQLHQLPQPIDGTFLFCCGFSRVRHHSPQRSRAATVQIVEQKDLYPKPCRLSTDLCLLQKGLKVSWRWLIPGEHTVELLHEGLFFQGILGKPDRQKVNGRLSEMFPSAAGQQTCERSQMPRAGPQYHLEHHAAKGDKETVTLPFTKCLKNFSLVVVDQISPWPSIPNLSIRSRPSWSSSFRR